MFYSETLLSKTGPLSRVWLAANLERKVSKTHILQSNIETQVSTIVDQGQAPLALRLSGQLLLGVVRIYSRKARYLLDDCNEAILKIKMAFKPGNVDLPANQSNAANIANLTLPDVITEIDLLGPMPDQSLLLGIPESSAPLDSSLLDFSGSQRLSSSIEKGRRASVEPLQFEDPDFGLDLDLDLDLGDSTITPFRGQKDLDLDRNTLTSRQLGDEVDPANDLDDIDLNLDLDLGDSVLAPPRQSSPPAMGDELLPADQGDIEMGGVADDGQDAHPLRRASSEPLSPPRSIPDPELEQQSVRNRESSALDVEESVHHAQRAKRRRILPADQQTEMSPDQIRAHVRDRSKILKPASFLPKDPVLLALMDMQRNGTFLSSILGDGQHQGLAPELRGIMSLEVISRSADLKRKRNQEASTPSRARQLQIQDDLYPELDAPGAAFNLETDPNFMASDGIQPLDDQDLGLENEENIYEHEAFDETTIPLVYPADSGPVSLGTKHAVHLLRDKFGSDAEDSPAKRQRASVLFQELLPESKTTRADATKMFFEVLVLATKDAIKVEQPGDGLGAPLRVRGKRGLWGAWAEKGIGNEAGTQEVVVAEE